ncbi:metal-dependent hydrolase [Salinibacterium sp. ZJ454]|uniref:metal-dependent hydrolase n=1 Tax=Salinibacterium sp. ZJ454 TaxID=2708339 RepID=UPI00141F2A8D|nr:metal-dependent hydrolase [Salinibacterium sp. ZJ454]
MTTGRALTWLGSAGLRIDLDDGRRIYVDPWLDSPAFPEGERDPERIDAILVTHAHIDHAASAPLLSARYGAPVYAQTEVSSWLTSQGAFPGLPLGMNKGGTVEVCGVEVTMVHAEHTSSADGHSIGTACGFVLDWGDGDCVYIAGDTDVFSDMRLIAEIYRPRLAVLPVGGLMTMGPRQAAAAFELLGRPDVLPYHWGSAVLPGTPDLLREALRPEDADRILSVAPGDRVRLADVIHPEGG